MVKSNKKEIFTINWEFLYINSSNKWEKIRRGYQVDNGESSYRRFLDGDDEGLTLIIKDYKDGLILYLNNYVNNIYIAEDLMEETFFKIAVKKPKEPLN